MWLKLSNNTGVYKSKTNFKIGGITHQKRNFTGFSPLIFQICLYKLDSNGLSHRIYMIRTISHDLVLVSRGSRCKQNRDWCGATNCYITVRKKKQKAQWIWIQRIWIRRLGDIVNRVCLFFIKDWTSDCDSTAVKVQANIVLTSKNVYHNLTAPPIIRAALMSLWAV